MYIFPSPLYKNLFSYILYHSISLLKSETIEEANESEINQEEEHESEINQEEAHESEINQAYVQSTETLILFLEM